MLGEAVALRSEWQSASKNRKTSVGAERRTECGLFEARDGKMLVDRQRAMK